MDAGALKSDIALSNQLRSWRPEQYRRHDASAPFVCHGNNVFDNMAFWQNITHLM